uniref:UstYa family oxidase phomYd n=1 Tax=Diaporthe leptostromiformis TaxID=291059 RepID=PHYD1_DIALO|nr:RecName: Full=UstYa family oxidase phomYd; AltName: Full=Phomopsin biosynthesis cluster protein Yd [Diaporthe leptostromiformis]BDA39151.1 DUF3328 [Diaporthe leptostromiformis]
MEKFFSPSRHNYADLSPTDVPASEESDEALEEKQFEYFQQRQHRRLVLVNRLLAASTVALVMVSLWLGWELHTAKFGSMGSFQYGFKYELEAAKKVIKLEEYKFLGSPIFLDDGTELVPEPTPGPMKTLGVTDMYVGEPSKELDWNWNQLHWGRFFLLTEDEARQAWGPGYKEYWAENEGGYIAGLEVTHSVHCVDMLRKALRRDVYPLDSPLHGPIHTDHCLNHLRQMILCQGDLTPIPSKYYRGITDNYIFGDMPHTCRNWDSVREFITDRFNGSSAVPLAPGTVLSDPYKKLLGILDE